MKRETFRSRIDWFIVIPTAFILLIGLTLQSSIAYKTIGVQLELSLTTQVLSMLAGITFGFGLHFLSIETIRKRAPIIFASLAVLLLLVLFIGVESGGAQRWISIGGLQIQPTEFAKLALILLLARIFDTHRYRANSLRVMLLSLFVTGVAATLIAIQPDLGSAVVLMAIWLGMLISSRITMSRYALVILTIAGSILLLVPFLAEYQQERLVSYFNPTKDTSGAAYNVTQASIAIGSGGLTGNGLSSGSQSQLNFLPSQHTDFIFAVLSEKLGLLGAGLMILALTAIILRLLYRAWIANVQFVRLLFVGVAMLLTVHMIVNVGMNLSLVPVTGLPLPLLSYGGSFMFVVTALLFYVSALPRSKTRSSH